MDEILKSILEGEIENVEEVEKKIDELLPAEVKKQTEKAAQCKAAIKGALKLLGTVKGQLPNEGKKLMGLLASQMGEKYMVPAKKGDQHAELSPETQEKLDTLFKQNEDLVQKNEDLVKKNDELEKQIGEEKDKRVTKEFEDQVRGWGYAGEEIPKVAKVLKESKEKLSKESYEELESRTKAAVAKRETAHLFKEAGSSQGGSGGSAEAVEAKAQEIMKADPKLSKEQAITKVYENEPELYKEYLDENPSQGGY